MKLDVVASGIHIHAPSALRTFSRDSIRVLLEAIDAGHLDSLRHYAEHGTLPPEPPVWGKCEVIPDGAGKWHIRTSSGRYLASVSSSRGRYTVDVEGSHVPTTDGPTPQAAVDAARTWLADRWGLST